jgi:hypothetical protein
VSVKGFLDDHYEKCRQEFYSHVRPWIVIGVEMAKATGWRMSYDQYTALIDFLGGMNSYERKVLRSALDDLAICELTQSCLDQFRTLGELDVATTYDEAVQRELAPLLVKRLRGANELIGGIKVQRDALLEGNCSQIEQVASMTTRAAFAEKQFIKAGAANEELHREILVTRAERDTARKQAATWEIQAQDLRDQLIQVKSELAALKAAEPTYNCFACGQPMETTLCWECAR